MQIKFYQKRRGYRMSPGQNAINGATNFENP